MLKRFGFLSLVAGFMAIAVPQSQAASDYSPELQAYMTSLTAAERERFDEWWSRMPAYFKDSLHGSKFENWREVVYCDYLGFKAGTALSETCVEQRTKSWQQNASQWNADGTFRGPSEACVSRGRTDEYGRLICVDEALREQVQDYWDSLPHDQKLKEFSRPGHFWEAMQHCAEGQGYEVGSELYSQCELAYANRNVPIN